MSQSVSQLQIHILIRLSSATHSLDVVPHVDLLVLRVRSVIGSSDGQQDDVFASR